MKKEKVITVRLECENVDMSIYKLMGDGKEIREFSNRLHEFIRNDKIWAEKNKEKITL